MKVFKMDENAHFILCKIRDEMQKSGIENATLSDAVRELDRLVRGSNQSTPSA